MTPGPRTTISRAGGHARHDPPARDAGGDVPGGGVLVGAERDERAAHLGHAVHLPEATAEPFDRVGVDVERHGGGAVQDLPQAGQVGAVGRLGLEHEAQHLRHQPHVRGVVPLHRGQSPLRGETGHQHDRRAGRQVGQRHDHAAVVQRAAVDHHDVVGGAGHHQPAEGDGPERRAVDRDSLGLPGGRRGVQHGDRVGVGDVRQLSLGGQGAQRREGGLVQGQPDPHRRRQPGVPVQQRGLTEDGHRTDALDDPGDLGLGQAVVQRHEQRAQPGQREVALQDLDPVLGEHGDPVTPLDAQLGQAARQFHRAVVEFGPGDAAFLVHQRGPAGPALAVALQQLRQPHHAPPLAPATECSATKRS
jgi:hypothetical protein